MKHYYFKFNGSKKFVRDPHSPPNICRVKKGLYWQNYLPNLNIFISLRGHFRRLFRIGESSTNLLNLSESALNSLEKSDLIQKILHLKGKVVIDADLHKLCEKIKRLTESMNQIVAENKKLQSDIAIMKNVNRELEDKIVYLEKKSAKGL